MRRATPSSRSRRRAAMATRAPARASASAVASPIPDDAPVTSTTLPCKGVVMGSGLAPGVA